jgi:ADP-dependent NAD(P)H-hydrate dehydratase / NAD(P)H-hydrate epimerase
MAKFFGKEILKKLSRPNPASHKGENGRVFVIAGSTKFHGALILCIQTASRVVDMVYVHTVDQYMQLMKNLKSEIATFIGVTHDDIVNTINMVDVVIIGPGLEETEENIKLLKKILIDYPDKKIVIDATAFWHLDPNLLHKNCIVTPHSREFKNTFQHDATPENVKKMAAKYGCVVVLTGETDYISNGQKLYENKTGNVGMTKGGTGDVLVGLVGGLFAVNDSLVSAMAATYLTGTAGDRLLEAQGTFYNANDLIGILGKIWKEGV